MVEKLFCTVLTFYPCDWWRWGEEDSGEWKEKSRELRVQTSKIHRKRRGETPRLSTSHWFPHRQKQNKQNKSVILFVCLFAFASLQIVWKFMVKQPQMATF